MSSTNERIEKAELWKKLKDKDVKEIEGQDLTSLNFEGLDLSGKIFKNCDVTKTDFSKCIGLPTLEDCKINKEKVTSIMVIKTDTGNKIIYSMMRGSKPFYAVGEKEVLELSREREAIDAVRRFLV